MSGLNLTKIVTAYESCVGSVLGHLFGILALVTISFSYIHLLLPTNMRVLFTCDVVTFKRQLQVVVAVW